MIAFGESVASGGAGIAGGAGGIDERGHRPSQAAGVTGIEVAGDSRRAHPSAHWCTIESCDR